MNDFALMFAIMFIGGVCFGTFIFALIMQAWIPAIIIFIIILILVAWLRGGINQ